MQNSLSSQVLVLVSVFRPSWNILLLFDTSFSFCYLSSSTHNYYYYIYLSTLLILITVMFHCSIYYCKKLYRLTKIFVLPRNPLFFCFSIIWRRSFPKIISSPSSMKEATIQSWQMNNSTNNTKDTLKLRVKCKSKCAHIIFRQFPNF